jgi:Glycine-rich protein domain (DUF2403)/Putative TOS1-like glycosyl hydrolase (DUF2401)
MTRTLRARLSLSLAAGLIGASFGCSSKSDTPSGSGSANAGTGASATTSGAAGTGVAGANNSSGGSSSNGMSGAANGGAANSGGTSPAGGANSGGAGSGGSSTANLGAAQFAAGDLDDPSNGGTITMQMIGAVGSYPSVRDPASGTCDAFNAMGCCMTKHQLTDDMLSPWNEELIMSLRGPMLVKQFVVYQPPTTGADHWSVVSSWDDRNAAGAKGVVFDGNATKSATFSGVIGSSCIPNAETDKSFPCGPMSAPYCTPPGANQHKNYGWTGSKMIVVLAAMPTATSSKYPANTHCDTPSGGWYDAPWFGLSHGELIRAGAFSFCQCYGKDPNNKGPADGCGQFNVFEVVNDDNSYTNLSLFSTDAVDYQGYVGEGPCGSGCGTTFPAPADLIDKTTHAEAAQGGITTPTKGPGVAFRRPLNGYRYFITLLDVDQRTIQMAIVHPNKIPPGLAGILPNFPLDIPESAIDAALAVRLPK